MVSELMLAIYVESKDPVTRTRDIEHKKIEGSVDMGYDRMDLIAGETDHGECILCMKDFILLRLTEI